MVTTLDAPPAAHAHRPRWTHAVVGAAYALVVAVVVPSVVAPFVWWGSVAFVGAAAVVVAVSCALGGFVATRFVRGSAGWIAGVAGVVPALLVAGLSATGVVAPAAFVAVSVAGASSALLAYSGRARVVGALLGAVAVLVAVGAVAGGVSSASLDAAEREFGTRVAPYVTEVDGFTRGAASPTPMEGVALVYESAHAEFVLTTEPVVDDDMITGADQVCMLPLDLLRFDAPLDAQSCEASAGGWVRLSESRRELAVVVDGVIVRAGADLTVDEQVLRSAISEMKPITDAAYRELLDAH